MEKTSGNKKCVGRFAIMPLEGVNQCDSKDIRVAWNA